MQRLTDLFRETKNIFDKERDQFLREEKEKQRRAEEAKQREISNYRSAQAREAREEMNALATIPFSIILIILCIFVGSIIGVFTGCGVGCSKYGQNTAMATGCGNVTPEMKQGQSETEHGFGVAGAIFGGIAGIGLAISRYEKAKHN